MNSRNREVAFNRISHYTNPSPVSKCSKNNQYVRGTFQSFALLACTGALWLHLSCFLKTTLLPSASVWSTFLFPFPYHSFWLPYQVLFSLLNSWDFSPFLHQSLSHQFPAIWLLTSSLYWGTSSVENHNFSVKNSMDFYSQVSCFGFSVVTDHLLSNFSWHSLPLRPGVRSWWPSQCLIKPKDCFFLFFSQGGVGGKAVHTVLACLVTRHRPTTESGTFIAGPLHCHRSPPTSLTPTPLPKENVLAFEFFSYLHIYHQHYHSLQ